MPTIKLPPLRPYQASIASAPARFKVLACGRRWGKTVLGVLLALERAIKGGAVWWVAPSYGLTKPGWDLLTAFYHRVPGVERLKADRIFHFPGGGWLQVKSADDPNSLRSVGLDLVVFDEAAFASQEAWVASLRPALSDRRGDAVFISTPNGRNWFYDLYLRGQKPLNRQWQSWQRPTSDNPMVGPDEIAQARAELPEMFFNQEYLALFTDDASTVFRNVRDCIYGELGTIPYAPSGKFYMGGDLAQMNDFTVLTVIDAYTRQVVDVDRFNKVAWAIQRDRIKALAVKWNCQGIWIEENSIGGPNIEELHRMGLRGVEAFTTTNTSKDEAIRDLVYAFEVGEIGIPNYQPLLDELGAFQMERLKSGRWRYTAPGNMHDDTVMSLAIAWQAIKRPEHVVGITRYTFRRKPSWH